MTMEVCIKEASITAATAYGEWPEITLNCRLIGPRGGEVEHVNRLAILEAVRSAIKQHVTINVKKKDGAR